MRLYQRHWWAQSLWPWNEINWNFLLCLLSFFLSFFLLSFSCFFFLAWLLSCLFLSWFLSSLMALFLTFFLFCWLFCLPGCYFLISLTLSSLPPKGIGCSCQRCEVISCCCSWKDQSVPDCKASWDICPLCSWTLKCFQISQSPFVDILEHFQLGKTIHVEESFGVGLVFTLLVL